MVKLFNGFDVAKEVESIENQIRDYFVNNGPEAKAVIGISGGKDSTIAAALLVRALGADRVVGVLMPNGEQSDIEDAYQVCSLLKIKYIEINIKSACDALYEQLQHAHILSNDAILTNTPARVRMTTLYAVAASVGGRVINTGNRSELYIGYTTKYGDLAGDFSIWRTYYISEVYAIGDYLGLPINLVHKDPSDGMSGKTDEDRFGFTYEELDNFLMHNIHPDYTKYKQICQMHERNIHKERVINIPAVRKLKYYCDDYEVF